MWSIALVFASSLASFVIADCSIIPIYLDIHTRQVQGANNALSYGAYVNVGTPVQQLSLWPSLEINETTLAGTDFCSASSSSSCSASTAHGLFDPSKSTSFKNAPPTQIDNTSVLTGSISTLSTSGTDILHLWSELVPDTTPIESNVTDFPVQLLSNYTSSTEDAFFGPAGLLGLGSASTLLTSLHAAGKIASRSYGLHLGSAFPRNNAAGTPHVNGSLTLGGYDAARFQDPVEAFQVANDANNAFSIPISRISLSTGAFNGTTSKNDNLLPSGPITAHLSTSQWETTLPSSLQSALSGAAGSITITLGANLTITLPSSFDILFSNTGPCILGSSALTQLYLSVVYDASPANSMFYLAPALPTASYVNMYAFCPSSSSSDSSAIPAPTPQPPTRPLSFFVKNGLVGLIVGGSIALLAFSVPCCIVCVGCLRRRRSKGGKGRKGQDDEHKYGGEEEAVEIEMGWLRDVKGRHQHHHQHQRQRESQSESEDHDMRRMFQWGRKGKKQNKARIVKKQNNTREEYSEADININNHNHSQQEEMEDMYFAPPPKRATTVMVSEGNRRDTAILTSITSPTQKAKNEKKLGLKGILKVKVPPSQ